MFTKKQLEIIRMVGKEGLSLKVAASRLGMTYSEFMEEFNDNTDSQLAYEKGQAELEVEVVTVARAGMLEGDIKKFEFFANSVLNMSGKNPNKEATVTKTKKSTVPPVLLNPNKLLEVSDDELQRKIELKNIEEEKKNVIIVDNGEDTENENQI